MQAQEVRHGYSENRGISVMRAIGFALVLALVLLTGGVLLNGLSLQAAPAPQSISVSHQPPDAAERNAAQSAGQRQSTPDAKDRNDQVGRDSGVDPTE